MGVSQITLMPCLSPDQPTQPMNISYVSTKVDHEGTPSNLFSISWSPGNNSNSIIHYVVQLDNNLPVWVRNASATLISDASLGPNHILRLKAVDKCGQKSETVMQVLRATDDATTSTSQFHTAGLLNKGRHNNCTVAVQCVLGYPNPFCQLSSKRDLFDNSMSESRELHLMHTLEFG